MKVIYMECTLNLLIQTDPKNTGFVQNLLAKSEHCQTSDKSVKYIKIENHKL